MMQILYENKEGIRFLVEKGQPLLDYPEAVGILALEQSAQNQYVLLVKQFRRGAQQESWEIPAGKKQPNESLEECAQRELLEETGYQAQSFQKLFSYYPAIGISTEKLTLFQASALKFLLPPQPLDSDILEVKKVSAREVQHLLASHQIIDSKTLLAFYFFLYVL